ncbi:MAG: hypothetical protein KF819_13535 [Labilithrix sp.]|nr:hypothetical protein [Labilithrix sp.]
MGSERKPPTQEPPRRRGRWALLVLAGAYLVTVWLDGVGTNVPAKLMPRPWVYFAQVSALFPNAAITTIDYRAQGWSCDDKRWVEIDVRPYFLVDRDNKENRFHRSLQFYRRSRNVMRALDDYVVKRHVASGEPRIGGVRFLSLRVPYPPLGSRVSPYERLPLSSYPEAQRKHWYWSPKSLRAERCGQPRSEGAEPDDEAPVAPDTSKDPEP